MNDSKADDDDALLAALEAAAGNERQATCEVLASLAIILRRNVAVRKGYASAFDLLVGRLGYSEAAAYKRIQAAKAVLAHPRILVDLKENRLTMSAVVALAPHLSGKNGAVILESARGKTSRELERMIAGLSPRAEVIDRIRTIQILPDGEERVQFTFAGGGELRRKVERARELMRHKFPGGRLENIFSEAVELLLEKKDPARKLARARRKGKAAYSAPAAPPVEALDRSRKIPEGVKLAVWGRDEGKCSFVGSDGLRCGSSAWLEFDHVQPFAMGGPSDDPKNVRLLCRAHNQHMARVIFGEPSTAIPP